MMMVRNLVQIGLCVCLTGCTALPGSVPLQRILRPESSDAKRQGGPVDSNAAAPTARGQASEGGVVYLELFGGKLRERAGDAPPPLPEAVVVPVRPNPDRIPALQRELVRRLTLEIEAIRTKLQDLNARVTARPTPPDTSAVSGKTTIGELKQGIARIDDRLRILASIRPPSAPAPSQIEVRAVRPVAHTEPIIPGDAPDASQREINRLIAQCLSDLEKEIRELGDRVRVMTPPGVDREAPR